MENQKRSNFRLFLRTLTPSATSVVGSLAIIVLIVGFHLLLLSNQPELFLPHVAGNSNDQLAQIYEYNVLGPLDNLFGNDFLGLASTALIWGLTGWVVYSLIDFGISSYQEWRRSDEDIAYTGKNKIVRHPLHSQIVTRIFWRFIIGILAISGLFVFRTVISSLLFHDVLFLRAETATEMVRHIITILVGWLIMLHMYVVLLRLFTFRTRIFGEIID